jgi:hypothetical protein
MPEVLLAISEKFIAMEETALETPLAPLVVVCS